MGEIDKMDKIVNNALKGHNNSSVGRFPTEQINKTQINNK